MAKNEAKIKFTAETGEFNSEIKKSNNEMSKFRSEMKLNEAQMDNTGRSVEGLTRKHDLLQSQLKASQNKVEALSGKVEAAKRIFGDNSEEVSKLERQLANAKTEEERIKQSISQCNDEIKEQTSWFSKLGNAASGSSEGFTVAKGAIADLASEAIQFAIGKVTEFIGWLRELPEATRELRQDMATLETSFDTAGLSSEQATNTWKELYAVFGEDDRAVEAANLIAKMSDNQKDLNDWVTITTGVWGQYQDSLPVEGLAEASMESARTGQVTGVLADALNWSSEAASMFAKYMGEDVTTAEDAFNEALKECSSEEERQALITETLTKLYGDSAEKYRETAGAQMEAKEATAENTLAQADMADAIEPVTTAWDNMKAQLTTAVIPAVEKVSGVMLDALDWMKEHPTAVKAIAAAVAVLAAGITGLVIGITAWTIAQWALNSALLPVILPILGIVAAIAAVVAIVVVLVEHWDTVKAKCSEVWDSVKATFSQWGEWINTNVVQPVKQFFSGLWDGVQETAVTVWDGIKAFFSAIPGWFNTNVIQPVVNFFTGLWQSMVTIWNTICNAVQVAVMMIGSILSAAFQIITLPFRFIWENCKQYVFAAWEWIKAKVSAAINAVKTTITNVMNQIKAVLTPILNSIKNTFSTVWNAIKSAVTTAVNAVKSVVTRVWNSIKTTATSVWNSIKSVVTSVWNSIKSAVTTAVNAVKSVISSVFNAIKSTVTSIWNGVKSTTTSVWNNIKSAVSNVVNGVKSTVTSVFNGIKSTATSVWNGIKNAIVTPIEAAKNKVKSVVDSIKGFFSGMKLSLPKIKLPHFKITGKLSLNPPSVPKLSIDWYKDGGIMMSPTIFGVNGNRLMAGGEAGPEAIAPISKLQGYIASAVDRATNSFDIHALAAAVEDLANRPVELNINGRQFAYATASDGDSVNGLRSTFKSRGLIVE